MNVYANVKIAIYSKVVAKTESWMVVMRYVMTLPLANVLHVFVFVGHIQFSFGGETVLKFIPSRWCPVRPSENRICTPKGIER